MQSARERHAKASGDGSGGGDNSNSSVTGPRSGGSSGGRDNRNDRGSSSTGNWRQGTSNGNNGGSNRRRGGGGGADTSVAAATAAGGAPVKLLTRSNPTSFSASTSGSGPLSAAQSHSSGSGGGKQHAAVPATDGVYIRERNQGTGRAITQQQQQQHSGAEMTSLSSGGQSNRGGGGGQQQQQQRRNDDDDDGGPGGSGGGGKEKPRRERRDRNRRQRSRAHGREIEEALNDPAQILLVPSQHPQPQQQQRVIVDPNSFQRQVMFSPTTSSVSSSSRDIGMGSMMMNVDQGQGGGGPHSGGGGGAGTGDRRSGNHLHGSPSAMMYGGSSNGGGGNNNNSLINSSKGRYMEYDYMDPFAVPPPSGSSNLSSSGMYGKASSGGGNGKRPPPAAGRTVYSWQGTPQMAQSPQPQQQHQFYQYHSREGGVNSTGGGANSAGGGLQDLRMVSSTGIGGGHPHSSGGSVMGASSNVRLNGSATAASIATPAAIPSVGQMPSQTILIPPAMTCKSVKFMDENGKISENAEQWLSDHPGHFVVGVLGGQGVGKSTLLSSFAGKGGVFPKQTRLMAASANHQTVGIDMYVTSERIILLDTEPLYSVSSIEAALKHNRIPDGVPPDIWVDQQALVVATFLFSVCNVVILMTEESVDTETYRLLSRVDLFLKALSQQHQHQPHGSTGLHGSAAVQANASGSPQPPTTAPPMTTGLGDWCADIILVTNKVPVTKFNYLPQYRLVVERLAKLYENINLRQFGGLNMGSMFTRFERAFVSKGGEKAKENEDDTKVTVEDRHEPPALQVADFNYVQLPFDATLSEATSLLPTTKAPSSSKSIHHRNSHNGNHILIPGRGTNAGVNGNNTMTTERNRQLRPSPAASAANGNSAIYLHSSARHIGLDGGDIFQPELDAAANGVDPAFQFASAQSNMNAQLGVGSSTRDVFAKMTEDQEPWKLWARGLRNKVLSLSMRPLGGPALGSRNRPGLVSEREWFRYAVRALDMIQKAEYVQGFVRVAMLAREG